MSPSRLGYEQVQARSVNHNHPIEIKWHNEFHCPPSEHRPVKPSDQHGGNFVSPPRAPPALETHQNHPSAQWTGQGVKQVTSTVLVLIS